MSTEDKGTQGIKVTDKRRFDEQGQERDAVSEGAASGGDFEIKQGAAGTESREITFGSFAMSLATQALMQLGEIKPPEGVDLPVDRQSAKQTIDLLSMLEFKTRGNLDQAEKKLLEEILHNLHIIYVKRGV